jgi:hypothetical protein
MLPNLAEKVAALLGELGKTASEVDFVLDYEAPEFTDFEGFCTMLSAVCHRIPHLSEWRTFTILGTSFPSSMGKLTKGINIVKRMEWQVYLAILSGEVKLPRIPTFGDYCIGHPSVLEGDMRKLKPSATIRYTIGQDWLIIKGTQVRKNRAQYYAHSETLLKSGHFFGPNFSAADSRIAECANRIGTPGDPCLWRQLGTNHHIEKVVSDFASLSDLAAAV